jgi:hypothetical protein
VPIASLVCFPRVLVVANRQRAQRLGGDTIALQPFVQRVLGGTPVVAIQQLLRGVASTQVMAVSHAVSSLSHVVQESVLQMGQHAVPEG